MRLITVRAKKAELRQPCVATFLASVPASGSQVAKSEYAIPSRICQSGDLSIRVNLANEQNLGCPAAVFELLALVALVLSEYLATSILLTRG